MKIKELYRKWKAREHFEYIFDESQNIKVKISSENKIEKSKIEEIEKIINKKNLHGI